MADGDFFDDIFSNGDLLQDSNISQIVNLLGRHSKSISRLLGTSRSSSSQNSLFSIAKQALNANKSTIYQAVDFTGFKSDSSSGNRSDSASQGGGLSQNQMLTEMAAAIAKAN